jgi:hypothetical protein
MGVCDTNAGPEGPSLRLRRTNYDEKEKSYDCKEDKNDQPPHDGAAVRQNDGIDAD